MKNPSKKKRSKRFLSSNAIDVVFIVVFSFFGALLFLLPVGVVLLLMGWWKTSDSLLLPYGLSYFLCLFFLFKFNYPPAVKNLTQKKNPFAFKTKRGRNDSGESSVSWHPGCLEDQFLSHTDHLFDLNGDGHLDPVERTTRFDMFFGDDE